MNWLLLTVSAGKEPWAQEAQELYLKKIKPFCSFEIKEIKPKALPRETSSEKKKIESEALLSNVSPSDYLILFDEKGRKLNSGDFSKAVVRASESGKRRVVLMIGGAFGVDDSLRTRADLIISLSDLVFNHHVAKVVALEQLYRGWTIIKGIPYHNK